MQLTTEKIQLIRDRLKEAQDRQKSYADLKREPIEYSVGDKVFLKISPWKGVLRFGKRGKQSPRCHIRTLIFGTLALILHFIYIYVD